MDIDALTDDDRKQLAKDLAAELDTGLYGNRAVLSRRQLLTLAGGSAGVAGLVALGVDPATAQSAAGQVGTPSSPETVYAFNLDVQGALQRDLDAGGQAITNAGLVSTADAVIGARQLPALDANGDVTESGSSVTIDLSESYDYVLLRFLELNTNTSGTSTNDITVQVNGVTSNYTTHRASGSNTSSAWVLGEATEFGNGRIVGEVPIYKTKNAWTLEDGLSSQSTTDPVLSGTHDGTDQKIDSLTFSSANGVDIDVKIFGADYQS